jgi:hypothetical protein
MIMKPRPPHLSATTLSSLLGLALLVPSSADAAITAGDPNAGGIGYAFQATLGTSETASVQGHVGAWSWEDQGLFAPGEDPVGWTHTSNWFAVTLEADSRLTLTVTRDTTVPVAGGGFRPVDHLYPSFSVWSGWDNDAIPEAVAIALGYPATDLPIQDHHTYNNDGAIVWAEDLTFLDSLANTSLESVSRSWSLPAGQYSIVIGSNAPSETNPPRQGYRATFTTTPVPEPATAILSLAGLTLLWRRRR